MDCIDRMVKHFLVFSSKKSRRCVQACLYHATFQLHIATVIQFNFEKEYIDNISYNAYTFFWQPLYLRTETNPNFLCSFPLSSILINTYFIQNLLFLENNW
jgi:hypothetical protein